VNGLKGYETAKGLAPDGGECEFNLLKQQIDHFRREGPEHKFWELFSLVETLKEPVVIAEGLKREGFESALCYVGKPKRYGDGWESPTPPKMVFLVCMTQDFKIFEWRWEKEDQERLDCPENAATRFTKITETKWKR
jgi:hypothetical protein